MPLSTETSIFLKNIEGNKISKFNQLEWNTTIGICFFNCICVCIYIYDMCVCMYVCICVCMYVYVYVCIHILYILGLLY